MDIDEILDMDTDDIRRTHLIVSRDDSREMHDVTFGICGTNSNYHTVHNPLQFHSGCSPFASDPRRTYQ